jgi:hypothetical protein
MTNKMRQIHNLVFLKGLYCSDSLYENKQRYVQLFLRLIEKCGLRSYPELMIRIVKITMVGAVKIKHKKKNINMFYLR